MPACFSRPALTAVAAALAATLAAPAFALTDPANDFVSTYTGTKGADLDVLSAEGFYDPQSQTFSFHTTLAGAIGTTPSALYVWGLDRGAGTQRFVGGTPSTGAGVSFDSVLLVRPDGTGQVNDLVNAKQTVLKPTQIKIDGADISVVDLPASLFPSTGLAPEKYTWNLWPRQGTGNNAQISDFAPDASNAVLQIGAVPEPQSWALMAAGLVGGLLLPRRRAGS